ncbi:MAG: class I SAM-dependent methyltransferase [Anaerolineae bacterium]|nr:class I SAM-dependent methyltransferase [Anaerolineae bacterium]
MESIRGKTPLQLTTDEFSRRVAGYKNIWLDLGTGDGRFVRHMSTQNREDFFIGLDACRENLREHSRDCPANALYLIASAQSLPAGLDGLAAQITINFPWGSLLHGLLDGDLALLDGLARVARPNAELTIRLNGGALAEAGWALEAGTWRVYERLQSAGFNVQQPRPLDAAGLRACPTTWARRLAYGRDPRGWLLSARISVNLIENLKIDTQMFV